MLAKKSVREEVFAYLAGICKKMDSPAMIIGGIADHVHILCRQSKNVALKDLIQHLKQDSSKWVKRQWSGFDYFYWQRGYGAFSVSPPHIAKVREYILNQEAHHREVGFQDELRSFLERYQVPYDERHIWD